MGVSAQPLRRGRGGWRRRGRPSCRWGLRCRRRLWPGWRRCGPAVREWDRFRRSNLAGPIWVFDDAAVAVAGVLAQADVGDEDQLFGAADCLMARRPCCTIPFSSHAPVPCSSLVSGRPKRSRPPIPRLAASSASRTASSTERLKTPGMEPMGGERPRRDRERAGRSGRRAREWFRAPASAAARAAQAAHPRFGKTHGLRL
jgi:hypothetical protein